MSICVPFIEKRSHFDQFYKQIGTKIIKKERQNTILAMIRSGKYCTVKFLSEQLYVASITIRRDLTEVEASGLITKCYGGATIPNHENREVPFEVRKMMLSSILHRILHLPPCRTL